jgi:hypothetical protein
VIRYVLIVALAATMLGITAAAVDQTGTIRGERAVQTEIETVDAAATSLYDDGTVTVGAGPRRLITVEIHEQQPTKAKPEQIRFERIDGTTATRVTYRVRGGQQHETKLDVPIRHADGGAVELTNWRGTQRLVLRLARDDSGEPVVTIEPYN